MCNRKTRKFSRLLVWSVTLVLLMNLFNVGYVATADGDSPSVVQQYDFESYDIDHNLLDSVTWKAGGTGQADVRAVIATDIKNPYNKAVKFYNNGNDSAALEYNHPTGLDGNVVIEYKFLVTEYSAKVIPEIRNQDSQTIIQAMAFSNVNYVSGQGIPIIANTWHTVKLVINISTGKFDVYKENEATPTLSQLSLMNAATTTGVSKVRLQIQPNQALDYPIYFDDLRMYKESDSSLIVHPAIASINAADDILPGTAVTLSTQTQGGTIYYTTDGTVPTTSSAVYSNPIALIQDGSIIRTLVEKDGFTSFVTSHGPYDFRKPHVFDWESYNHGDNVDSLFTLGAPQLQTTVHHDTNNNENYLKLDKIGASVADRPTYTFAKTWAGNVSYEFKVLMPVIPSAGSGKSRQVVIRAKDTSNADKTMNFMYTAEGDGTSNYGLWYLQSAGAFITIPTAHNKYYKGQWKKFRCVVTSNTTLDLYVTDYDAEGIAGSEQKILSGANLGFTFKEIYAFYFLFPLNLINDPYYVDDICFYNQAYPVVEKVAASKAKGQVEARVPAVTLASNTSGASIYYTVDGTAPTMESELYSEQISITQNNSFIKAVAVKNGVTSSQKTFGPYTLKTFDGLSWANNLYRVGSNEINSFSQLSKGDTVSNSVTVYNDSGTSKNFVVLVGLYEGTTLKSINYDEFETTGESTTVSVDFLINQDNLSGHYIKSFVWTGVDNVKPLGISGELK